MIANRFVRTMEHRRRFGRHLGLALMLVGLVSIVGCPPASAPEVSPESDVPRLPAKPLISELNDVEQSLFWRINEIRRKNGLMPLTLRADLCRAARMHNYSTAQTGMVTHFSPNGDDIGEQLTAQGVPWNLCAENLAKMPPTANIAQDTADFWMDAPSGRKDILFHLYDETGLSAIQDPKTGQWFLTQIYARRTSYWVD